MIVITVKLNDKNTYLDIHISTGRTQCIEHEPRNLDYCTQNIQEWCKNCSIILQFSQIGYRTFNKYFKSYKKQYRIIKCNLCGHETKSSLCPKCYLISSEWIESISNKKPIPIVYLPQWVASIHCTICNQSLILISDCQKWCPRCFITYIGCRYCLTTNIIFGITEQSKCRKCRRVTIIHIKNIKLDNINVNLTDMLDFARFDI
ncbi:kinase-like domain-containing protein [Rhizophagus clarus]|uniref:Kinase-like domain-containing protein n=1 Tax=Rhizophagus clarus TaxID=94130 RepID=A0A8H3QUK7_9GLOM|nr:kinase-like domain-containing protein [Rhizophagus clarus]